jgi:hypothetical protein
MNWTDEPATWKQLKYLKQCGYQADRRLTKEEASELIKNFGGPPQAPSGVEQSQAAAMASQGAYHFRTVVESSKRALEESHNRAGAGLEQSLASAVAQRQQFWLDTFSGRTKMPSGSAQISQLYRLHGCLFLTPTTRQLQDILDALDSASRVWDRDHPEIFYNTLAMNFPVLARR